MRKLLVTAGTLGMLAWVATAVRKRPRAFLAQAVDYPNDDSTTYSLNVVALYRGVDVAYTGPLRRSARAPEDTHSYPGMGDGWCTTHDDYCGYRGMEVE